MTAAAPPAARDDVDTEPGAVVRPLTDADLPAIAALYAAHPDNPNPIALPLTAAALRDELRDRGTIAFMVAVVGDAVVGTFGLFESTGRRVAEPGQLLADMFFVAPEHRRGSLTGSLFAATVDAMIALGYGVLRLTVNPANAVAYRLYRRVGSLALEPAAAGADGNVELYNLIPLLLSAAAPHLPAAVIDAARTRETFRFGATEGRSAGHGSDVRPAADGTPVVHSTVHLGGAEIVAEVDAASLAIRALALRHDGTERSLPVPASPAAPVTGPRTVLRRGDWEVAVEPGDGAVIVRHPGFRGDLLAVAWLAGGGALPAWRRGRRGDFAVTATDTGLRIVDRADPASVTAEFALSAQGDGLELEHRVTGGERHRRLYLCGIRSGELRSAAGSARVGADTAAPGETVVVDTAEIPGAAPAAGTEVTWSGGYRVVADLTEVDGRLIDGATVDARSPSGAAVRFTITPPGSRQSPSAAPQVPGEGLPLPLDPGLGGARVWSPGGRPVLWGPHPRVRALGHLPQWRAGLWVSAERPGRAAGVGWGAAPDTTWSADGHLLRSDGIAWRAIDGDTADESAALVVEVHDDLDDRAATVWFTPRAARSGEIAIGTARLPIGAAWHRWARPGEALRIPLPDARELTVDTPAGGELLVRSTPAGLLVGGLCPPGSSTWRLNITRSTPTTIEEIR